MNNHYELLLLIHPDREEDVPEFIEKHKSIVLTANGNVDRHENWGKRNLAYSIRDVRKAYYVLLNVTCTVEVLNQIITELHTHNPILLRTLIQKLNNPVTKTSRMMQNIEAEANETRLPKISSFADKNDVDYKSKKILKNYIMETGRIIPSRLTNTSTLVQRRVAKAIKLARYVALLPYCDRHV